LEKIETFVPGHLTGLFEICNGSTILKTGSVGAGLSIKYGVKTRIEVKESDENKIKIYFNDKIIENAKVSKYVVDYYLKTIQLPKYEIKVIHQIDFPVGCGFGASGAGALGVSYGLNVLLNTQFTKIKCGQIAHIAEVVNKTGLGDVIAQTYGGVEIRKKPGAPGIGVLDNILYRPNLKIVCYTNGKIDTASIIGDKKHKEVIKKVGNKLIRNVINNPSIDSLMRTAYQFALETELMSEDIKELLENLHSAGYKNSSMIMLGNSIFCIVEKEKADIVADLIKSNTNNGIIFITDIDNEGARIIG